MLSCIEASPQPVFCPLFLGGTMKEDCFLLGCCQGIGQSPKCSTRSREAGAVLRKKKYLAEDREDKYKNKKRANAKTGEREKYRNQGWWREMKDLAEGSPRHPANVTGKRTKTQRATKTLGNGIKTKKELSRRNNLINAGFKLLQNQYT